MLVFKESTYIENRKYYEGIDDYLVREYHDIFNKIDEVENYPAPSEIVSYLYRELEGIEVYNKAAYLIMFFNKAIKNDIKTIKVWTSYLDIHMDDERYVEDAEMLIEYRSSIESIPLAIRGERYDVIVFIDNVLKALELKNDEAIEVLNNINYNNLELPDEEFEDYEPSQEEFVDRAYYEQRPHRYSI